MDLSLLLIIALVLLATVMAIWGVRAGVHRGVHRTSDAVASRLSSLYDERPIESMVERVRPPQRLPRLSAMLEHMAFWDRVDGFVRASGKSVGTTEIVGLSLVMGLLGLVVALVVGWPGWLATICMAAAASVPWLRVRSAHRRRIAIFEQQFPEAIDLIARTLRAGHSLPSSLRLCGDELPQPLGREFRRLADEIHFGVPFDEAIEHLIERVPVREVSYFSMSLRIQRESGGNLVEIIGRSAAMVRQRMKLRDEVRALSSQGRLSAKIMLVLPVVFLAAAQRSNPKLLDFFLADPLGMRMGWFMVVMMVIGAIWTRRVARLEV